MLGILLVNFLCTDSMRRMSFERLDDQTGLKMKYLLTMLHEIPMRKSQESENEMGWDGITWVLRFTLIMFKLLQ